MFKHEYRFQLKININLIMVNILSNSGLHYYFIIDEVSTIEMSFVIF